MTVLSPPWVLVLPEEVLQRRSDQVVKWFLQLQFCFELSPGILSIVIASFCWRNRISRTVFVFQ